MLALGLHCPRHLAPARLDETDKCRPNDGLVYEAIPLDSQMDIFLQWLDRLKNEVPEFIPTVKERWQFNLLIYELEEDLHKEVRHIGKAWEKDRGGERSAYLITNQQRSAEEEPQPYSCPPSYYYARSLRHVHGGETLGHRQEVFEHVSWWGRVGCVGIN